MNNLNSQDTTSVDREAQLWEAAVLFDNINFCEEALASFQDYVCIQEDTLFRSRNLLNLTLFYYREFGVAFEKRHAFRAQLGRVLTGELETVDAARDEAQIAYTQEHGPGLPELKKLIETQRAA